MKRGNENGEGGSGESESKKVKFFDLIDKSDGFMHSAEIEKNSDFFGNNSVDWGLDLNLDLMFGNEKQQISSLFDLNVSVPSTEEGYTNREFQENTQKGSSIDEKRIEIIDISSDDSDHEVEVVGFNHDYKAKGKEIDVGSSHDTMEQDLNLGLGFSKMVNIIDESSSILGGETRYTREEKGKAKIEGSWLSLNSNYPIDLDSPSDDNNDWMEITEPKENVEFIPWVPEPLVNRGPDMAQLELERRIREEESARRRAALSRQILRETARRFARVTHPPNEKTLNGPSNQESKTPVVKVVEPIGKLPGPFSEALKRVRERTVKKSAQQLIEWKSVEKNGARRFVPSLLDLSLKALAKNAKGIVSLEMVPNFLRKKLIDELCDTYKMNVHVLDVLVKGCQSEIRVQNCAWLKEEEFQATLGSCRTENLAVLQLDLCGQCMLDFAFRNIISRSSNSFSNLAIISLRGACRLTDDGLKKLVESAPKLQSVNMGQCTLLTCDSIKYIADYLGSNLRELYIDDCFKIDAALILNAFKKFEYLEVLSVAGIQSVTDWFIGEVVNICGKSIKELDLANCLELTDTSLKTIGSSCINLRSLNLSNLNNLTDFGIENLANGCRSIQNLNLCQNKFSDEAIAAFLESSGESLTDLVLNHVTMIGPNTALSLAKCARNLLRLDISWCRGINDEALGLIVDSCLSLKLLKVFRCSQITHVFMNGHSNSDLRIVGYKMTPLLEDLNLFESNKMFLRYSPLPNLH